MGLLVLFKNILCVHNKDHMKKRLEFYKNKYINYINKKKFFYFT